MESRMKGGLLKNFPLVLAGVSPIYVLDFIMNGEQKVPYALFQLWAKLVFEP